MSVGTKGVSSSYFSEDEYRRRIEELTALMAEIGVEGLLLAEPSSIYYYTGYNTLGFWNFQLLIVSQTGERCIVCFFEEIPSAERVGCKAEGYAFGADPVEAVERAFRSLGLLNATSLGIDADSRFLPVAIEKEIAERFDYSEKISLGSRVTQLRLVKSQVEIAMVREAAAISSTAMRKGLEALTEGVSDTDVAIAMHAAAIRSGGEYFSIPPIVKFGATMTEGHLTWRGSKLMQGDGVNLEIAGVRYRYHAPLLRCAMTGRPTQQVREAMEVALQGLQGTLDAIRPGVTGGEVDAASAATVAGSPFIYQPAGYSVGIGFPPSWMEANLLAEGNQTVLEAGMTLHVVPCVLLPGLAHLGASETVLVTNDGIEVLTDLSRELRIV